VRLLISDANILIDFDVGDLLPKLFQLEATLAVPDVLFEEELKAQHPELPSMGLEILRLRESAILRAVRLAQIYRRAGRNDLLALVLAEQEHCPLLTGDQFLRAAAEREDVEVHGSLWVADRMHREKLVDADRLSLAFEQMRDRGRRLPWAEVRRHIRRWRRR
jgi:predicted nucleic acid-binding protein